MDVLETRVNRFNVTFDWLGFEWNAKVRIIDGWEGEEPVGKEEFQESDS